MADFMFTPTLGTDFRARENFASRQTARRAETARAMREFGDLAAAEGRQLGVDDWAEMARQNLSFSDFMNGTNPSVKMIEQMRLNQNQKAEQQAELRRREQFNADRNEEESIRKMVGDMAIEGKSNEEIAAFVAQNFPERSAALVPRIGAMTNAATLQARQQAFEVYGRQFYDVQSAQEFIKANPGLNPAMRQGILEVAEINQADVEQKAFTAGEQLGREYGYLPDNEQFSRNYIDRMLPATIKGERRMQLIERALGAAREAYRAKLAGQQVSMGLAAQTAEIQAAPQRAERLFQLGQQEEQRRAAAAQATAQQFMGSVNSQVALLGEANKDNPMFATLGAEGYSSASSLFNTYVFDNPQAVIEAIKKGDQRAIKQLTATARPITEYISQAQALSNVVSGATRFSSGEEAVQAVTGLMSRATSKSMDSAGQLYGAEYSAAQQQSVTFSNRAGRSARASVNDRLSAEVNAAAQSMGVIERNLVDDTTNLVLSARQAIIDNGSLSMTPEEVRAMAESIISKSLDTFLRSANLPRDEAEALRQRITEQAMARATLEGALDRGIQRRPTPDELLRSSLESISTNRGAVPGYGWLPSQAPGDVRAPGTGVSNGGLPPNQRWWQR